MQVSSEQNYYGSVQNDLEVERAGVKSAMLFFDPGCPWTWKTARWLFQVADHEAVPVQWLPFKLELLLEGGPVPEAYRRGAQMSTAALRIVARLNDLGRGHDVRRYYEALGRRVHDELEPPIAELAHAVASEVGLGPAAGVETGGPLDDAIEASSKRAQELSGPRLGSPVVAVEFDDGRVRGAFGPVLTAEVSLGQASDLWRTTVAFLKIDAVSEVKQARGLHLELDASLTPHVSS
ncbi:MAG: DsbA family protein [Acidimicrobiales bacterium]